MIKRQLLNAYRRLFVSRRFVRFHTSMYFMALRGLGILNHQDFRLSGEKFLIEEVVPRLVRQSGAVFFDVGANVGDYSSMLRSMFAEATIHAFEPHPTNFACLRERHLPNVHCHNLAVGDSAGSITLFDRADNDGSKHASIYAEVITDIQRQESVGHQVTMRTLDDVAAEQGIEYIDYLKIDTEGNELAVIHGASRLFGEKRIGCVHFEFNEMNVISRSFFRDFRHALSGFDLYRLLPDGMIRLDDIPIMTEIFAFQNIVAIPCGRNVAH